MDLTSHGSQAMADNAEFSDLTHVAPKTAKLENGELVVGGVNLVTLAKKEGTAMYVYDVDDIENKLSRFSSAMKSKNDTYEVIYAGKAFICGAMLKLVDAHNCWLDTSSGGEVALAHAAGFPMKRVISHGNNKTPQEIEESISLGVGRFVVDTKEELKRINEVAQKYGVKQKVLLRITPGVVADTHKFIRTGTEDSKFGFSIKNNVAKNAVEYALSLEHIELTGFHMHIGSQIFKISSFAEAINIVAKFCKQMHDVFNFNTQEFDMGGGLGVAYKKEDTPPSIEDYCTLVVTSAENAFKKCGLSTPKLFIEPGRSVVANAGITMYTIGSIKEIQGVRTYINVDGGMSDNIRPVLYDASYEVFIANKADKKRSDVVTVAGKHCESGDIIAVDSSVQKPDVGDILCVFATGAYGYSMASNYNMQPKPAVIFVKDGSYKVVVRRQTYKDLLLTDNII